MSVSNFDLVSINKKLDNLSLSILSTLSDIIQEREYLHEHLKEGYINLAKSRYIMKEQKISMLQINVSNLQASLKIYNQRNSVEDAEYVSFNSETQTCGLINGGEHPPNYSHETNLNNRSGSNTESNLKHRSVGLSETISLPEEEIKKVNEDKMEEKTVSKTIEDKLCTSLQKTSVSYSDVDGNPKEKSDRELSDPLRWFGVLVPDTLKSSQKHFKQTLIYTMNVASLQNKLKLLCELYRNLRIQKKYINKQN